MLALFNLQSVRKWENIGETIFIIAKLGYTFYRVRKLAFFFLCEEFSFIYLF